MPNNLVVRELGPVVQAFTRLGTALYRPPKSTVSGIDDNLFPNPLQPITPMGPPGAEPLGFPMDWGINQIFTPRAQSAYSATQLRLLATYPLARMCIDNTKDILTRIPWKIQLRQLPAETSKENAARGKDDADLKYLQKFFDRPNPEQDWDQFIRPILDDMLVIDAAAIFMGRAIGTGNIVELRWVEGASITRVVEQHGWTPPPPNPAYQQLWQGYPRIDLTTDQLCYRPRNIVPRGSQDSFLYGMSPVETVAEEIKIGQARLQFIYDFYSQGTIPGGIIFAPVDTPPTKIKEAQDWLDSDLAGRLAVKRRLQILQGFQRDGDKEQIVFPNEPDLASAYDDTHSRRICFAFGTSPERLTKAMNRSSSQAVREAAEEEGILPFLRWLKGTMDYIIQVQMKKPGYEWTPDPFLELDKLKQAMADSEDVKNGLYTINQKRRDRGDEPDPNPAADQLAITTAQGRMPIESKPLAPGGITNGGGKPKGSAQPKASAGAAASSGSTRTTVGKAITKCEQHGDSYPRDFCTDCIKAAYFREADEEEEVNV